MGKLYTKDGYPNIEYLDKKDVPFNILTGGRGTGKTYGLLQYYHQKHQPIIYMRRTETQIKIVSEKNMVPYKKYCDNNYFEYKVERGAVRTLYINEEETPTAYFCALSTFSNVRGFDASDCTAIVFDEFIPEKRERPIRNEGEALLNAYETVNRNRELYGEKPLKIWLLSNTNDIVSPILSELGLLETALRMEKSGEEMFMDRRRGLQMVNLRNSPISERKEDTALYKIAGQHYKTMALQSSYNFDAVEIKPQDLRQFTPLCRLGEITFYQHKSDWFFYATTHRLGTVEEYGSSEKELSRFLKRYGYLYDEYVLGNLKVENMEVFYILETLLRKNV